MNLTFEVEPRGQLSVTHHGTEQLLGHGDAQYSFTGKVLRVYSEKGDPIAAVSAGPLRFFLETKETGSLKEGEYVSGEGTLSVDYYAWIEFLHMRQDAPDISFNLAVSKIRRVTIPDRFIRRQRGNISSPARVLPADFGQVTEVEVMDPDDESFVFYVLDLEQVSETISPTFIGAPDGSAGATGHA